MESNYKAIYVCLIDYEDFSESELFDFVHPVKILQTTSEAIKNYGNYSNDLNWFITEGTYIYPKMLRGLGISYEIEIAPTEKFFSVDLDDVLGYAKWKLGTIVRESIQELNDITEFSNHPH